MNKIDKSKLSQLIRNYGDYRANATHEHVSGSISEAEECLRKADKVFAEIIEMIGGAPTGRLRVISNTGSMYGAGEKGIEAAEALARRETLKTQNTHFVVDLLAICRPPGDVAWERYYE